MPAILADSGFYNSKPTRIQVPMILIYRLKISEEPADKDVKIKYQTLIGKLSWLATKTRPDLA